MTKLALRYLSLTIELIVKRELDGELSDRVEDQYEKRLNRVWGMLSERERTIVEDSLEFLLEGIEQWSLVHVRQRGQNV